MENPYGDFDAREERYAIVRRLIAGLAQEVENAADDKEQLLSKGRQYFAAIEQVERLARKLCTLAYNNFFTEEDVVERKRMLLEIVDFNKVCLMVRDCRNALYSNENVSLRDVKRAFTTLFQEAYSSDWMRTGTSPLLLPTTGSVKDSVDKETWEAASEFVERDGGTD